MAKKTRALLPNNLKRFEKAIGLRYPDNIDSEIAASVVLDRLSYYLEHGYDLAAIMMKDEEVARLIVIRMEDEWGYGE